MTTRDLDEKMMREAIARAQAGNPSPNPPVGAVVLDAYDELVSTGHHPRAGEAHAESIALEEAGRRARGGTLYVTLEPCNHQGRTPPCVDAVLRAGVRRVVIGCRDPNPHVEGKGIERLRGHGVEVTVGVLENEALTLIEPWTTFITSGMPFVSLKLALSLDGRIASRTGVSKWVTGPEARAKVQELRAQSDAIAVGINTVLADDPLLTVRDPDFAGRAPTRIVFDSKLRTPRDSRLVTTVERAPVVVLTTLEAPDGPEQVLTDAGVEVVRVPSTGEGRVDLESALRALAEMGIVSLLIEGGAELAGTTLTAHLVHRLHAFMAPILLGPRGRPGAVDWAGPDSPQDAPRLVDPVWELVGSDAYVSGPLVFPSTE